MRLYSGSSEQSASDTYQNQTAEKPRSAFFNAFQYIDQVGCIYTPQGFEFDFVDVIVGEDLMYDFDTQSWIAEPKKSPDTTVERADNRYIDLVKNTYRVLLTRGFLGCHPFFIDKDTERFVKSRMEMI